MMVVMLMFVIVVVVMFMLIFIVIIRILDGFDPAGRFHGLLKIETSCIEDIGDFDLCVVGFNDLSACLQAADDLFQKTELLRRDHVHFIEEDGVAELELLDEKILDIFFLDGILGQASAVLKFVVHARAVDDSDDVVKFHRKTCVGALLADVGDGLGDRDRLADAGGFNNDIVILLCLCQFAKLVGKIVSQCAANAAVCQRYKIAVFLISEALQSESSCNMNKWDAHRVMYSDKHVGIKCATVINEESKEGKRNEKFYHIIDKEADYYIFCKVVLVGRNDKSMLNLNNWFFYIIPNWYLVSESGNNNRISIKKIERMVQATGILDIKTKLDSMIKNE